MLPEYKEIRIPLLIELIRRGGASRPSTVDATGQNVYEALARHFSLSDEALNLTVLEGENRKPRSKWENVVRWVRNDLKKMGLLTQPKHGIWEVTEEGKAFVQHLLSESHLPQTIHNRMRQGDYIIDPATFDQLQERARYIGAEGEAYVLEYEKQALAQMGLSDLAQQVTYMSAINVAAGYDVLSFSKDGEKKYIEVKTSAAKNRSFELTRNELEVARQYQQSYWIYKVDNIDKNKPEVPACPSVTKIQNPWSLIEAGILSSQPSNYTITIPIDFSPA